MLQGHILKKVKRLKFIKEKIKIINKKAAADSRLRVNGLLPGKAGKKILRFFLHRFKLCFAAKVFHVQLVNGLRP